MDVLFGLLDSDSESEDEFVITPRRYRARFDFHALNEDEVISTFRLRRQTIEMLEARIRNDLRPTYANRRTDLVPLLQLLIALR
jgi:hypothetical protein